MEIPHWPSSVGICFQSFVLFFVLSTSSVVVTGFYWVFHSILINQLAVIYGPPHLHRWGVTQRPSPHLSSIFIFILFLLVFFQLISRNVTGLFFSTPHPNYPPLHSRFGRFPRFCAIMTSNIPRRGGQRGGSGSTCCEPFCVAVVVVVSILFFCSPFNSDRL